MCKLICNFYRNYSSPMAQGIRALDSGPKAHGLSPATNDMILTLEKENSTIARSVLVLGKNNLYV